MAKITTTTHEKSQTHFVETSLSKNDVENIWFGGCVADPVDGGYKVETEGKISSVSIGMIEDELTEKESVPYSGPTREYLVSAGSYFVGDSFRGKKILKVGAARKATEEDEFGNDVGGSDYVQSIVVAEMA